MSGAFAVPSARAWRRVVALAQAEADPQRITAWIYHREPALAARLLRLERLAAVELRAPLCRADAEPLAHRLLVRVLCRTDFGAALERVCEPLGRLLAATGPRAGARAQLELLARWRTDTEGRIAEAPHLEARDAAYQAALRALAARPGPLGTAAREAARRLAPRASAAPFTVLACTEPPLAPELLLPGLRLSGAVYLHAERAHSPASTRPRRRPVGDLARIVTQARRWVEGYRHDGPWHAEIELDGALPPGQPPTASPLVGLRARSCGLAVLAALHFAVGHRHPLPPSVAFTGALGTNGVEAVERIGAKAALALEHCARLLLVPEANLDALNERTDLESLHLLAVPSTLGAHAVLGWLEDALAQHYPGLMRHEPERLVYFLHRAEQQVRDGSPGRARVEFRFLERTTARDDASLLERNVHAVALCGLGRACSHEVETEQALAHLNRARAELDALARERALLPLAWPSYLELDNYRAVVLIDLLRHEEAIAVIDAAIARAQTAGALCPRTVLGAMHGTRGQALTFAGRFEEARAALERTIALVEPHERDRDHVYLATAELRGGALNEACARLSAVIERNTETGARASWHDVARARRTAIHAALRLLEALARALFAAPAATPLAPEALRAARTLAQAGLDAQPLRAWQRAVRARYEAVLAYALGQRNLAQTRAALARSRQAAAVPPGASALHPDHTIVAASALWEALVAEQANDPETAQAARNEAEALLAPFLDAAQALCPPSVRACAASPVESEKHGDRIWWLLERLPY